MHTTGQAFPMAFQAGGSHAQDRGLEAVASALRGDAPRPGVATWEKPQGKRPPLRMAKRFRIVPRGVSLLIGCATFPTWNGYPGLFASLATGNPVLVKPSRRAVLPLAITVAVPARCSPRPASRPTSSRSPSTRRVTGRPPSSRCAPRSG